MDNLISRPPGSKGQEGSSELGAILELQNMIAKELDLSADQKSFTRSFTPLTDGLGLDRPKRKELPAPPPPRELQRLTRKATAPALNNPSEEDAFLAELNESSSQDEPHDMVTPAAAPKTGLAAFIEPSAPRETTSKNHKRVSSEDSTDSGAPVTTPPPVPRPSLWRRAFATFVDEVFVLLLFSLAVLITLNVLDGTSLFSVKALNNLAGQRHPELFKFALLEFSTLWFCYFAVCLGLIDMTFGMWVWGIRVGYGTARAGQAEESRAGKKFLRILLSFLFFAPVAPLVLLVLRFRGRNLLDLLSGTHLYRSMV